MPVIVGFSAHYHDSACCVLKDGVLVAAAQEERFTKQKHDAGLPTNALRYCLREAGVTLGDVSCVAYYEDPKKKIERQLYAGLPALLTNPKRRFRIDAGRAEAEIRDFFGYAGKIEFVDHHLSHAASAFFYSGFQEAALMTVDGVGEWATTTYGRGAGHAIDLFEEVQFPDSLGLLYSTLTAYLGFEVNDAEYKVMGLAPYGKPIHADRIRQLIETGPGGQYRLKMEYFDFLAGDRMYSERLPELFGEPVRPPESDIAQFHKDVASSLQVVLEEILLEKARYLHERCASENLCMAGGVALNCVANGKILRDGPFARLFVQPAASDAGSALGAAAVAHVRVTGERPRTEALAHVYLGPAYTTREIAQVIDRSPLRAGALNFTNDVPGLLRAAAERLAGGKVIGWFHGRMEFGPRSLGARSILADPRRPEMRDRVNELVKMREAFRPFAPAVLMSKASAHFDLDHPSPFMLETCDVCSPLDLPAITHVDNSARVQTVDDRSNPRFHALLTEFDRITGCPILLNTSFNLRGEPIVMDPIDAIWTFARSNIDTLVLEDYIIDRSALPSAWGVLTDPLLEMMRTRGMRRRSDISTDVYTFL